jgi:uncharacterized membrane protein YfcA
MEPEIFTLIALCIAAFLAGFVDAIVGGGGLIQTPAALILLPQQPVATVIGSLKIPSFSGTFFAAKKYLRQVSMNKQLILFMCATAFLSAFAGSQLLTRVSNQYMKPVIFIVLLGVAIYTYTKKNLGQQQARNISNKRLYWLGIGISIVIGFYDGFIGPGAGSFLVLSFIAIMGFDFLHASAYAKMVNLATNLGSILLFTLKGKIMWYIAIPMAMSNAIGGILGAGLALKKGNRFIRIFFLIVITLTLLRFGYDVFLK